MYNDAGTNGPIMGVSFLAAVVGSMSLIGIVTSVLVALLVGLISKGIDILVRRYFQNRENFWRREAREWKRKYRELSRRG